MVYRSCAADKAVTRAFVIPGVRGWRRWPQHPAVVVIVGAVVVVAAAALLAARPSVDDAEQELGERLRRSSEPDRFEFHYRAAGSTVLNCFLPNREFWGALDYQSGVLLLRTGGRASAPTAMVAQGRAVLHQSLFPGEAVPTTWVEFDQPQVTALPALQRALGVDLAGYVVGDALPSSGRATALAALDVARRVDRIGNQTIGSARADGYRLSVNADKFADEASPSTTIPNRVPVHTPVPSFEIWLGDDNTVLRIVVQAQGSDGEPKDAATAGWTIDYLPGRPVVFTPPTDVTAIAALDLGAVAAPAAPSCQVPS